MHFRAVTYLRILTNTGRIIYRHPDGHLLKLLHTFQSRDEPGKQSIIQLANDVAAAASRTCGR